MKKAKRQKPKRRKTTRADLKTQRANAMIFAAEERQRQQDMKLTRARYLEAGDAAHWHGEASGERHVYDTIVTYSLYDTVDMNAPAPVEIEALEEDIRGVAEVYDPEDPDSIEPITEPLDNILARLEVKGLITVDREAGMVELTPLPAPAPIEESEAMA